MRYKTEGPVLMIAVCLVVLSYSASAQIRSQFEPNFTPKIFIEHVEDVDFHMPNEPIIPHLKRELEALGIVVVDDAKSADAILTGTMKLDSRFIPDDQLVVKAYIYKCELASPDKKMIWRAKIKIPFQIGRRSIQYRAQKIAERVVEGIKQQSRRLKRERRA